MAAPSITLPPGFRFVPTEQELVLFWLQKKVRGEWLPAEPVVDCDIYREEPWKIFGTSSGQKFYVFTKLRKRGEKRRVERTAGCGTWKGQRSDPVKDRRNRIIGHNKLFVFEVKDSDSCNGHWLMHEFSLDNDESDYVVCEVRNKNAPTGLEEKSYYYYYSEEVEAAAAASKLQQLETGQQLQHGQCSQFEANPSCSSSKPDIMISSSSTTAMIRQEQERYDDDDHDDEPQPKRLRFTDSTQQEDSMKTTDIADQETPIIMEESSRGNDHMINMYEENEAADSLEKFMGKLGGGGGGGERELTTVDVEQVDDEFDFDFVFDDLDDLDLLDKV